MACVLGLLGGCAVTPAGVDKDLVDDWGRLAEAKVPEPAAGDCWTSDLGQLDDVLAAPGRVLQGPCDFSHAFETVHVGHFTGTAASGGVPPSRDEMADAYAECDAKAKEFLGGAWQTGRLHLLLAAPSSAQWAGGARFYRCDVGALRTEAGYLEPRKETLKGGLAAGSPLLLGCGNQVAAAKNEWSDITPSACTSAHDTEFVGVVTAKTPTYPADDKAFQAAFDDPCEAALLAYTGMSPGQFAKELNLNFGYWSTGGQQEWKGGNHTARCYAMIDKKKLSRSVKGNGNADI